MQDNQKKKRIFHSLSARLIAAILALLMASVVLVSGIWYTSMSSVMQRDAGRNIEAGLSSLRVQLDGFLRSAISVANQMSYSNTKYLSVIENGPYREDGTFNTLAWELEDYMSGFFAFSESIRGIVIISPSGYLFQSGLYISPLYHIYEKPFVQEALLGESKAIFVLQNEHMYSSTASSSETIDTLSILTPIKVRGKVYGVVMLNLDYAAVTDLIGQTPLPEGSRILALLSQSRVLVDSRHPTINALQAEDYALPQELRALYGPDQTHETLSLQIEGQEVRVVLEHSGYADITLMGIVEQRALLSSINEVFSASALGLLMVALPLMGLLIFLIHRITRELRTLRGTMVSVGETGTDVRAAVHGRDEVAELALTFNQMMERMEGLMRDIKRQEKEKRRAERDVFRAQINPHFLYNTLGTIRYLATLRGARNIENITTLMTQLLRASLDDTREMIPLSTELEFTQNYMSLQKYRYLDDVRVEYDIEEGIRGALVPRMLLQPLLENALMHGFEGSNKRGLIRVSAALRAQDLVITIWDDGKGIPPERLAHLLDGEGLEPIEGHTSIGLRNVHRRLQLAYSEAYGLHITSNLGEYTEVTAVMPYRTEQEDEE